ncbi:hypothetical protein [Nocardia niwae]|uniref:hypothetical protein n=1 Tax=Nocardia niwae TaxID=626084 RepID=UPI0007A4F41D|nr:hypothetical protein [Nocardia niwae]
MSGLPNEVRAFLQQIAGTESLERLNREADLWANSGDLNEGWIAGLRVEARELLIKFDGDEVEKQ